MMKPKSYHVFDGYEWLAYDEKSWTKDFFQSAEFGYPNVAKYVGEREAGKGADARAIYVMACITSF